MKDLILVIDEGTTSTRALAFTRDGQIVASEQVELTQYYPAPGEVEHDATEIWEKSSACCMAVVKAVGGTDRIAAIGITNQRETIIAWDKTSGQPLARALVWQDRRTAQACAAMRDAGHEALIQRKTGLLLDPYFSASKMRWLLENQPAVASAAKAGTLAFGTIESWLVWKLSGGKAHITDATNASRTSLMALDALDWDDDLLALFAITRSALPAITDCAGPLALCDLFGPDGLIPVTGMAGDQQAATIGLGCLAPGETKATFGTGAFVLTSTGDQLPQSRNRLLGTVLCQLDGQRTYALEGSVFVAGSLIQWLRDGLGLLQSAQETAALAASVPDNGGVMLVPALAGLGAPHWRADARASISGLSFATTRAHIARAALEAMAHQTHDLMAAFAADGAAWDRLAIDGGMSANDWMAQDLANILALPVDRPAMVESTALGAAMLAGVGAGWFASLEDASGAMCGARQQFAPAMTDDARAMRLSGWKAALGAVLN